MPDQALVSRRALTSAVSLAALASSMVVLPAAASSSDPIFAQIELHKALRVVANNVPGDRGDQTFDAAQEDEEAAIQALGDMVPTTIAAAAAQLTYMAEVEGNYTDDLSPLLRTVQIVAKALKAMSGGLSS